MRLLKRLSKAGQATYTCARCDRQIREGDRFVIEGTMRAETLRAPVGRTDVQIKMLGEMLCAECVPGGGKSPSD